MQNFSRYSLFYLVLGLGLIAMLAIAWFGLRRHEPDVHNATATSTQATSTPSLSGMSIYTNGQYGFSIFYPASMKVQNSFDTKYFLPATWRVDALPNATGTPIVAIVGYETTSNDSYPRYFETEVRVGASADAQELSACDVPSNGEAPLADKVINGITWKAFAMQTAGMMQYLQGTSYRTIHDGKCFAVEELETGSSYRDDQPSASDISQGTLDQQYAALNAVADSFSFAR